MGAMMRLSDIVKELSSTDQELTIYVAEPWSPHSQAMLAREPDEGGVPAEASGAHMTYFLEVFIAQEFVRDLVAALSDSSLDDLCERLVKYAKYDA
jgi:hypothetical protein